MKGKLVHIVATRDLAKQVCVRVTYTSNHELNCDDKCLIYLSTWRKSFKQYAAETTGIFAWGITTMKTIIVNLKEKMIVKKKTKKKQWFYRECLYNHMWRLLKTDFENFSASWSEHRKKKIRLFPIYHH